MRWQRFGVTLEDRDPVEVQTNARDWAAVRMDAEHPMDATFRVVHAAMVRQGMDVPRHYDTFLDELAGPLETVDEDPELLSPTPQGVSERWPSPSPSESDPAPVSG
jgi:hypothetical protein